MVFYREVISRMNRIGRRVEWIFFFASCLHSVYFTSKGCVSFGLLYSVDRLRVGLGRCMQGRKSPAIHRAAVENQYGGFSCCGVRSLESE